MAENITLNGSQASWELSTDGDINGTYRGTFIFKCFLNPTEKIKAGREYRDILGSNPTFASEHETLLAYALTQLKYRIIKAPPFWSSTLQNSSFEGDIPDENILTIVLDAAITAELKYKEEMKKKREESLDKARKTGEATMKEQKDSKNEA